MADRRPPEKAQDKLAFLLSLVPYLMDHDRVTVAQAAAHFGVSQQQIREAVELISVSGVPGATSAYQHEDLFDIAWDAFEERDEIVLTNLVAIDDSPRFSSREAAALIAGLQYLSSLPENADRAAMATLMGKLSRGASAEPSPVAVASAATDATLAVFREAVAAGTQVEFDYRSARGETERRRVDPLRVESVDADWYLRGWDHSRQAVRTFRLDRITRPSATSAPIGYRPDDVSLPDTLFTGSDDDVLVELDIAPSALGLIGDFLAEGAKPKESDGRLRVSIRVSHYHWLKRLVAGMPGLVTVVSPPDARAMVAEWAAAGLSGYDSGVD